jgi:broad specificity phosphatase PhoE
MTKARRLLATLVVGGALVGSPSTPVIAQQTTVIVVRHAEKSAEPANDPSLTAVGEARARALLAAVRDAGISAIITSQFARTKATAAPIAAALGLTPEVVPTSADPNSARVTADAIRAHVGQTVLVVGHSNTVPFIIDALGAKEPAPICDSAHDNLYIVTLRPNAKPTLLHAKYGERTPDDQGCLGMKRTP